MAMSLPLMPPEAELLRVAVGAVTAGPAQGLTLPELFQQLSAAVGRRRLRALLQPHAGLRGLCLELGLLPSADSPSKEGACVAANHADGEQRGAGMGVEHDSQRDDGHSDDGSANEEEDAEADTHRSAQSAANAGSSAAAGPAPEAWVTLTAALAAESRLLAQPEQLPSGDVQLLVTMRQSLHAADMSAQDYATLAVALTDALGRARYRALVAPHTRLKMFCVRLGLVDKQGNVAAERIDALMQRCQITAMTTASAGLHGHDGEGGGASRGAVGVTAQKEPPVATAADVPRKAPTASPPSPWRIDAALAATLERVRTHPAEVDHGPMLKALLEGGLPASATKPVPQLQLAAGRAHVELLLALERVLHLHADSHPLPLDAASQLLAQALSPPRFALLLTAAVPSSSTPPSGGDAAAWAADAGVVAHDAAGGAWVTPVRVALALEGVGSETGSLLEGTCAELWARTSESSASPRVRTVADHVLLRTLVDVFMAAGWPSELALDDLGAQLVLRLRSGRVQLLLDEYLGRLGRFARAMGLLDVNAPFGVLAEHVAVFATLPERNELDELALEDLSPRHQELLHALAAMEDGCSPAAAVDTLLTDDDGRLHRLLDVTRKSKAKKLAKALNVFCERYQLLDADGSIAAAAVRRRLQSGGAT